MNNLIKTIDSDMDILVSGRELHVFLEAKVKEGITNDLESFIDELFEISFKYKYLLDVKYQLLKLSGETYDYFHLIAIDAYFELLYLTDIFDENLTDNKRIPNGADNRYGNFFEKRIIQELSKYVLIKSTHYKLTDAIGNWNYKDFIIEIKCGKTNTADQVKKYQKSTGIKNFITVNGHDNRIDFTHVDVYRISKYLIARRLNHFI